MGKTYSERETRQRLLNTGIRLGIEGDIRAIFAKYDRALKNCTNEKERKHIAACGAAEIHNLFGCYGSLEIDGTTIIPPR